MAQPTRDRTSRTLAVAFAANICVAGAKLVAALITRSPALFAEATHASADVGNQVLLLIARRSSRRPRDLRHPLGYGREAYFWALIASVVVFVAGSVFSLRAGIAELLHPVAGAPYLAAYLVLATCLVFDAASLSQSSRQLRAEAHGLHRDFLDQLVLTSDPTLRAVFAEDAAAIAGDLIAVVGIAAHEVTGSSTPEGIAAVLIGLLLIGVGGQLARRNHDFLLGEQAPVAARTGVRSAISAFPGVVAVHELLVSFIGPRSLWVVARVGIDADLRGDEVERLVSAIGSALEQRSAYIARVDIVPIGDASPRPGRDEPVRDLRPWPADPPAP